jgi:crotonobetainyl-CoA:carnitine CoA-transferase CaiB-like acyl-CoA transferase
MGVLTGFKVIDLSRIFAGPAAAQLLGDLGADVIKIEHPSGDDVRVMGITEERLAMLGGSSPSFHAFNRNKRSVVLDLHYAEARAALLRLMTSADVLIHNFRPGVMEKWKLDYPTVVAINPGIIYGEFFAFGSIGPLAHVGANDLSLQAFSGLMDLTGERNQLPVRCGTAIVDLHGSLALSCAVLAALLSRERTGRGQRIEASLLLSAADLMSYQYADYWADGTVNQRMGTANGLSVPNQAFATKDGSVIIIAPFDEMWDRCANALDAERLNIPDFKRGFDRLRLRERLVHEISLITKDMTSQDLVTKLAAARVNVAKVNTLPEAASSDQLAAIGAILEVGVGGRSQRVTGTPFRLEDTPTAFRHAPPAIGAHTEIVLEEAGFSSAEIAALQTSGALGKNINAAS